MLAYRFRDCLDRRHAIAGGMMLGFSMAYWYFDVRGGFYQYAAYPSPSRVWIFLPTVEGLAYAMVIAWYETSFSPSATGVSAWLGKIGEVSYPIYMIHPFSWHRPLKS
jgi:peptidoglycan/LPS O-acetylase OafA/YrhL